MLMLVFAVFAFFVPLKCSLCATGKREAERKALESLEPRPHLFAHSTCSQCGETWIVCYDCGGGSRVLAQLIIHQQRQHARPADRPEPMRPLLAPAIEPPLHRGPEYATLYEELRELRLLLAQLCDVAERVDREREGLKEELAHARCDLAELRERLFRAVEDDEALEAVRRRAAERQVA